MDRPPLSGNHGAHPEERPPCPKPRHRRPFSPLRAALFTGYLKIGLFGFGEVAAWARRVIVEERRWMTERDYAEVLGLGQVLPGPNVGNAAVTRPALPRPARGAADHHGALFRPAGHPDPAVPVL